MRGRRENGVTQLPPLYCWNSVLPDGDHAPVLCLRLPSTPRFYTVRDQAIRLPGGTSFLSFISDVAVFPDPSLLRDCSFDPLRPSERGSHEQWPVLATPRNICRTETQRLRPGASPPQEKFARQCNSSVSGIMEVTTHIWHEASPPTTLFQHQRMWLISRVCCEVCLWGGCTAFTQLPPSRGTTSPHVA